MDFPDEALNELKKALPDAIRALRQIVNDESVDPSQRTRAASTLRRITTEVNKMEKRL